MSTYSDYANKTRSSKLLLCHIEPRQRVSAFELHSGTTYKKQVNYFIVSVKQDGVSLSQKPSATLTYGSWYYNSITNELYVRTTDDAHPKTHNIIVTYRLFYSNRSIDLPHDLNILSDVHYDGRINSSSPINRELDSEQIGIVLETSTNIKLENQDGYFDDIYDKLIFENAPIYLYSWNEKIPLSEKKKIFDGIIQNKSFSEASITFSCKDLLYKLRDNVSSKNFDESDGNVPERYQNTPKRKIYGKLQQLQCVPIDSILDGYLLSGSVIGSAGTNQISGTSTSFLDECTPNDKLIYNDGTQDYELTIETVTANNLMTVRDDLPVAINGQISIKPNTPWRKKNRKWHIAGHKLRQPSTTIAQAQSSRRFTLTDPSDFLEGDLIKIGSEDVLITRVSGDLITVNTALQGGIPSIGTTATKNPVSKAYINGNEAVVNRDWDVTNNLNDAILELNDLAEFNIALTQDLNVSATFTQNSNIVTISGVDFTNRLSSRDWIRSSDISHTTWYEILSVTYSDSSNVTNILLREDYTGATRLSFGEFKNVDIINDDSIITIDCIGLENSDGLWIKTASDAIKNLLTSDAQITSINNESFTQAKEDAPYVLSMAIPESLGGDIPIIREVIDKINKSVFGSLTIDGNHAFKYETLSPKKPTNIITLKDDDIIGVSSIRSRNEIVRKVNAKYRFYADKFTAEKSNFLYEFSNDFVDDLIGSTRELDVTLYLYSLGDVKVVAQRYALYNSLSQSTISIKGKLNLAELEINDRIQINLDRVYKRFGSNHRAKIGIINKISKTAEDVTIEINDLGNTFNRVANIAPNIANNFTSASDSEKIINNYIVDNDTLTPDVTSDLELFTNLIG